MRWKKKSVCIFRNCGKIASLLGPLDATFIRPQRLNGLLTLVFVLMDRTIKRLARKRDISYSFLFVSPDDAQLARVGELTEAELIRPLSTRRSRSNRHRAGPGV
ncbi:hypothetical protein VC273_22290 [Xanthomonas nasturtii]|uniref:hypothetical protein n=1 Tax=Xanthomonas TaxID=338 RepID=UPI00128FED7F|nr:MULTISPECIES: hypothetical protein [Xanthomonas]MEA9558515.1 hypothetical protein [Xanthomonas nasturtii]